MPSSRIWKHFLKKSRTKLYGSQHEPEPMDLHALGSVHLDPNFCDYLKNHFPDRGKDHHDEQSSDSPPLASSQAAGQISIGNAPPGKTKCLLQPMIFKELLSICRYQGFFPQTPRKHFHFSLLLRQDLTRLYRLVLNFVPPASASQCWSYRSAYNIQP